MGLQYITFMGRTLKNKKELMPVRIMNSVSLNSVGIFTDSVVINYNFME